MVGVAAAFAIAISLAMLSIRLGPHIGFVDPPDAGGLKIHNRPVPPLGGVGVLAGIHVGMALEGVFDVGLLVASTFVLILGLVDDRIGLAPKFRLGAEIVAGVLLIGMIDSGLDGPIEALIGVAFVVVAINAVNLLDGLDGLVGSVTVVSGLGLAWVGLQGEAGPAFGLVLAAAVAGFLVLNWKPARIFLGDNGAYAIGVVLAYAVVTPATREADAMALAVMGFMGVFLLDLGATILRRSMNGHPLFAGDRSHIYDQLRDRGWPVPRIAAFAAAVQAVFAAAFLGLVVAGGGIGVATVSIGLTVAGSLLLMWRLGFLRRTSG